MPNKPTPSVRGGLPLPQQKQFIFQVIGTVTVAIDPKLTAESADKPIKITRTGFWLLRSIKMINACCAG